MPSLSGHFGHYWMLRRFLVLFSGALSPADCPIARIGRVGRSKRFRKSIKHFNNALASKEELRYQQFILA